ncbi:MAG: hypothetical protein CTY20_08660 [Hyphomicrobium sp.]|nr:MAG: hypothetical protein CTY20_08660 [Hyphomicrobium sp.]
MNIRMTFAVIAAALTFTLVAAPAEAGGTKRAAKAPAAKAAAAPAAHACALRQMITRMHTRVHAARPARVAKAAPAPKAKAVKVAKAEKAAPKK